MLDGLLLTLARLPIYLALRHPYRRLPLQLDTGYYVPDHVVAVLDRPNDE
ncbi:MAG: hypothetical protein GY778_24285 [bacterium]|nr:hypothetical protein [bacterium]